jgi:hypothetical protein
MHYKAAKVSMKKIKKQTNIGKLTRPDLFSTDDLIINQKIYIVSK